MYVKIRKSTFKVAILSIIVVVSCGQISPNLKCNTHSVNDLIRAYDTTACSIDFYLINSLNRPLNEITVIVENSIIKQLEEGNKSKPETIQLKTDAKGHSRTGLFNGIGPLKIKILFNGEIKSEFEFFKKLTGYGYDIYIKLYNKEE